MQLAAVDALSEKSDEYLVNLRKKYFLRAKFLVNLLDKELDWKVDMPEAGMFLWAKIPEHLFSKTNTNNSFDFCKSCNLHCIRQSDTFRPAFQRKEGSY